ncbi:hypothetical protein L202_00862 [Cryptococcus amylolentus CBS 6039]|uniref:GST N-terminal domain-containing protein n=1 Tax=Cryptococcus amylolentus CBS 6039 TaxID=1295533 RepID=A0A1E3I8K0_9TREE|nr:hypothetical protein L202_00862 [Cryptococcus amylolentus CBS 6039]ODN85033.1 hypothetical protein L202_00862 [Cryptococcus amylolentus CBS 6039]
MTDAPVSTWGSDGSAIPSLELISSRGSRWAHRVLIALEEAHLPYKLTEVDLNNKPDWLFKANPKGLVPILGVGTPPTYLTESANIVSYITDHTPSIQPSTDLERARAARIAEVAVDLLAGEISPDLIPLGVVSTVQGLLDPEGPFALGQRFTDTDILIAPLVGRLWAYGNHALIPAGNLLTRLIEEDAKYARFLKYVKAISERDSWKKTWDEEFSISRLEKKIAQYKASQDKS